MTQYCNYYIEVRGVGVGWTWGGGFGWVCVGVWGGCFLLVEMSILVTFPCLHIVHKNGNFLRKLRK